MQRVVAHEGPQVQPGGRRGELLDLGLILLVLLELLVKAPLALHGVEAVISTVKLGATVLNLHAALGRGVQKIAVVADGQHRALKVGDVVLQPFRGPQVKVVGGLVQQQNVRVLQNEAGQIHPGLFAAGEQGKFPLPHIGRNLQPVCHPAALKIHVVAAQSAEIVGHPVVLPQQGGGGVPLHPLGQLVHAGEHGAQGGVGLLQHVLGGVALRVAGDLGDEAHAPSPGHRHRALVWGQLPRQQAEQRGFAAAVGAKDADVLAALHIKGQPAEHRRAHLK